MTVRKHMEPFIIIKTKNVGSLADISCFSLYPGKNLGAYGDAGISLLTAKNFIKLLRT